MINDELPAIDEAIRLGNLELAESMLLALFDNLTKANKDSPCLALAKVRERLAQIATRRQQTASAVEHLVETINIKTALYGPLSLDCGKTIHKLSELYLQECKYSAAEPLLNRLLKIRQVHLGSGHIETANVMHSLACLYHAQENFLKAEPFYKESLMIKTKALGFTHEQVLNLLKDYATLLQMTHRQEEAEHLLSCVRGQLSGRWDAIKQSDLSDEHD